MGKAMWELYGSSMGKNQPTFIFQKKTIFTHFYTNDHVPSPSPFDGLVRSQPIETYVRVQVIALKI